MGVVLFLALVAENMSVIAILKGKGDILVENFEVAGTGDQLLSTRLRDMQQKINERLTALVEEKRGKPVTTGNFQGHAGPSILASENTAQVFCFEKAHQHGFGNYNPTSTFAWLAYTCCCGEVLC